MSKDQEYLGYIKYSGHLVEEGFLDARKSAEALLGFDEILRFFVQRDRPELRDLNFEIPVRVQKGSWEALIPHTIGQWIVAALGLASTAYVTEAARKMAGNDFKDLGFSDVFRKALKSAQWAIKIAKHIGSSKIKRFENVKWSENNQIVEILNNKGEYLKVPKKYLDIYVEIPDKIFSKNTSLIEEEREMSLGVYEKEGIEEVAVTNKEKHIFYTKGEENNVLFPELKHGQSVTLEGFITRGNEKSNTIGFEYNGHVLTCRPKNGDIVLFKNKIISPLEDHFFPKIKIIGIIDRVKQNNLYSGEDRPQIVFSDIIPLEKQDNRKSLFN